ncbi:hypothetical protein M758_1G101100 [Ceratodon purpureus]|nr:hypothetical protein M758_1G101100 [Ceratodon purpureus]
MPVRVVCERHSGPLSLHCTEREVDAARLPRLARCALLQHQRSLAFRPDPTSDSVLGVGRPSIRLRRPMPGAHRPHPPPPAWVTSGRYTAQMKVNVVTAEYECSGGLKCKADGTSECT